MTPQFPPPPDPIPLDPVVRKKVLRMIPYGMYVVTSRDNERIAAATIDWVSQASFEPPQVVCCLRQDSQIYDIVKRAKLYALHPLGAGQKAFAANFFKNREASETHINGQPYRLGPHGVPLLTDAPAYLVLQMIGELTQGDHAVILGQIVAVELVRETAPLLLRDTGWNYGG